MSSTTSIIDPYKKNLLLRAIAQYIQRCGFSKTLKKFRSEAKIEKDDLGGSLFDLEEVFSKFHSHFMDKQLGDDFKVKCEERKRKKKNSDSLGQEEQVGAEVPKEPANNITCECPNKKGKEKKKKKSNLDSESVPVRTEDKSQDIALEGKKVTDSEIENKSKDKKKKKNKLSSDSVVENVELVSKDKQAADINLVLDAKNAKAEGKRKMKDSATSEKVVAGDLEELHRGKSNKIDSKKDNFKTSKDDVIDKQSKASKKRKRLSLEEDATHPAEEKAVQEKAVEESKRRKTEGSEEAKEIEESTKVKSASGAVDKTQKEESNQVGPVESQKIDGQVNGNIKNVGENSAIQKTKKKQENGLVEHKAVKHFQRVKVDEVVFSDERLQDNSYWAKDGAENGYGAKAQEILEQVRGRDFRHEKTKKKRGTYRGGQIDTQSYSIKFNYSDDD